MPVSCGFLLEKSDENPWSKHKTKENLKEHGVAVISYGQIHSKLNPFYKISDDLIWFVDESYLKTGNLSLVNQGDFIFADTSEDVQGCGNFIYVDRQQTLFAGYHTIILRSLAPNDNKFFAFLFMSDCWRKQIRECVNGVKLFISCVFLDVVNFFMLEFSF